MPVELKPKPPSRGPDRRTPTPNAITIDIRLRASIPLPPRLPRKLAGAVARWGPIVLAGALALVRLAE